MAVNLSMPDCHTFVSYFWGFQMTTIPHKLGRVSNLDTFFLLMRFISLVDEIQFMLISSHYILKFA